MSFQKEATSSSRTGVRGVGFRLINGNPCFVAFLKSRSREFNCNRLGREEAFRRALKARAEFELAAPDNRAITSERLRTAALRSWADPAAKARRVQAIRASVTPDRGEKISRGHGTDSRRRAGERIAKLWQDPAFRAKHRAAMNRPEVLARKSAAGKARWARRRSTPKAGGAK
jgi:hypothetical protein